ncbi:MAG: YdcF family protein [Propionicimonas sp.]
MITFIAMAAVVILAPTGYALAASNGRIRSLEAVASAPVAIVFGAGLWSTGKPMPYLSARLDLAAELFRAGKVKAILVSGDNRHVDYNEPDAMRTYLIDSGVPAEKVVADYAGFDTYATCVRAQRIFGAREAILTSQSYHLPRAIATCRSVGIDAWGVGDESGRRNVAEWRDDSLREWLANLKMAWDLLSRRQPLLGPVETSLEQAINS